LAGGGEQYGGELAFGGRTYPVTARGTSDHLSGSFLDGAQAFEFTATVLGGTMRFETDGAVFVLQREAAGAAGSGPFGDPVADPVADPFAPAAEAPGPAPSPWGPAPGGPSPAGGGLGPAVSGPGP